MPPLETVTFSPHLPQEPIEDLGAQLVTVRIIKVTLTRDAAESLSEILGASTTQARGRGRQGGARPRARIIGELLEKGLKGEALDSQLRTKNQTLTNVRSLLRAALEVDVAPRPCPAHVSESWWAQREEERLASALEDIRRGVREALALSEPTPTHKSAKSR